jgi:3-deoxy-D-manno-octulosonate 8-phosphate phosphatase (KDO 8-P phosphatase)
MTSNILEKAKKIKLAVFDVDGVLTDGHLYFDAQNNELKVFHVQDGLGIKLLQLSGVNTAIITSRQSSITQQRMQSLGVLYIYQGQHNKQLAFNELLIQLELKEEQVAYVGDDLPDLPLIQRAGLGIAVANAHAVIKQHAVWQTTLRGGEGAAREVCELIMQAQGTLEAAYNNYLSCP